MKRKSGLLKGQGFGKAQRSAGRTLMSGIDRVQYPHKPRAGFMPQTLINVGPERRAKLNDNFRRGKKPKQEFNGLPDNDTHNPTWDEN